MRRHCRRLLCSLTEYQVLLWENEEGFLFMLRGDTFLDQESFLRIAESVAYYEGPDTTYTLEWVPGE